MSLVFSTYIYSNTYTLHYCVVVPKASLHFRRGITCEDNDVLGRKEGRKKGRNFEVDPDKSSNGKIL